MFLCLQFHFPPSSSCVSRCISTLLHCYCWCGFLKSAWFTCCDLFITSQIVLLDCREWHVGISPLTYNCSHWNKRVFRTCEYRGSITTFAIREIRLLSFVEWKRESPQRAYIVEVGDRSSSYGCREKKGPEVFSSGLNVGSGQGLRLSPQGWMWSRDKVRGSLIGVEFELGSRPEALFSKFNVSSEHGLRLFPHDWMWVNWYLKFIIYLRHSWCGGTRVMILLKVKILTTTDTPTLCLVGACREREAREQSC